MSNLVVHDPGSDGRTLVDALLEQERSLTAADRFARLHEKHELPAQAKFYRDLIPLSLPAPGQQYAFEVDLDKCSGCKACVTACHALNGLDDDETWRDVGLLHSDDWRAPFQMTVTTACHHCVDPGCLSGCPVLAYDKDPTTGIVRHLDDQCIGCQYCVMKCPYEVPQYSARRGIVRKCDMCSSRLQNGEAPACVQACPSQAIRITLVETAGVVEKYRSNILATPSLTANSFLPTSPAPRHTVPTTIYKTDRRFPANLLAGDQSKISPAQAHLPLVFMLVLSQLAVGVSAAALFFARPNALSIVAATTGILALAIGTLHLGRPLKAWRAFLGWRTSWFSREAIALAVFVSLAVLSALPLPVGAAFQTMLIFSAAVVGMIAVACSAMVYADTPREFWNAPRTLGKFFGTTAVLGLVILLFSSNGHTVLTASLLAAVTLAKLAVENHIFEHLTDEEITSPTPLNKTARLLAGELGRVARFRAFCGVVGGIVFPLVLVLEITSQGRVNYLLSAGALGFCLAGELLERYLFFTAVAPAKMPGGAAA
jgi:formate dehydrogenase iron-sulfur subunit